MDKMGSLLGHGKTLFLQGVNTDGGIEACLEKIARQAALRTALNDAHIGARSAFLAKQEVTEQIEKYKNRLQYLSGHRRRLLEILIAQQERLEDNLNRGLEPTLSQLGLTLEEAEAEFAEINQEIDPEVNHDLVNENEDFEYPEEEFEYPEEEMEANPEAEVSHVSLNLSEPGLCDLEHPCSGEDGTCDKSHE